MRTLNETYIQAIHIEAKEKNVKNPIPHSRGLGKPTRTFYGKEFLDSKEQRKTWLIWFIGNNG